MDSSSVTFQNHEEACTKSLNQRLEEYVERYHCEELSELDETQEINQE